MKIIRDEECYGLMMIPLFVDWNVRRCNVEGCRARPTTIVIQVEEGFPRVGFCEEHFQAGNKPGGAQFKLEFDEYDAFATTQAEKGG